VQPRLHESDGNHSSVAPESLTREH
jgi:hypothetical protein